MAARKKKTTRETKTAAAKQRTRARTKSSEFVSPGGLGFRGLAGMSRRGLVQRFGSDVRAARRASEIASTTKFPGLKESASKVSTTARKEALASGRELKSRRKKK